MALVTLLCARPADACALGHLACDAVVPILLDIVLACLDEGAHDAGVVLGVLPVRHVLGHRLDSVFDLLLLRAGNGIVLITALLGASFFLFHLHQHPHNLPNNPSIDVHKLVTFAFLAIDLHLRARSTESANNKLKELNKGAVESRHRLNGLKVHFGRHLLKRLCVVHQAQQCVVRFCAACVHAFVA